jgi:dTDP-4-dehydrorhamnose 3,5-epimerase
MRFHRTKLPAVFEIHLDPKVDDRGFFARCWCLEEFQSNGLEPGLVQCSISFNTRAGTLRGMHYQAEPFAEAKLVRCTKGSIYDVVIDLRRNSPAFKSWVGVILTAAERNMLYVPQGCAHGFLTLQDETEVFYQISALYDSESARGVRWNDPAFQIAWPEEVKVISQRDQTYPNFE